MASTYSSSLKIQLMTTGENSTTWGSVTNTNLGTALEEAIVGTADVTFSSGDETLSISNSNATQVARHMRLNLTGTTGGSTRVLTVPDVEKVYIVNNGCADSVEVQNSTGSNVAVPAGASMWLYSTGANVVETTTYLPATSGGTGLTSPGTAGNVLVSDGTGWISASAGTPTGAVFHFAMSSAPTGFLVCDGSEVLIADYNDLYTAIDNGAATFGSPSDGDHFVLPNLLGQFIRGYNNSGSGLDSGRTFGSSQQDAIVDHDHFLARNSSTAAGDSNNGINPFNGSYYNYDLIQTGATQEGNCGGYVEANASGGCQNIIVGSLNRKGPGASTETSTEEVRPVNVSLLPCIKI